VVRPQHKPTPTVTDRDRAVRDDLLGIDWVDVANEPNHVEQFRNHTVRVYLATVPTGAATLYHRHSVDTRYVIMSGGRFRSDEPGRQRAGTTIGRSTSRLRQLGWLVGPALSGGWLLMPAGTLLVQPHTARPLTHRAIAAATNTAAIRMLGIELLDTFGPTPLPTNGQLQRGHADDRAHTYRLRLAPRASTGYLELDHGAVLAPVAGVVTVSTDPHLPRAAGEGHWIKPGRVQLSATRSSALDAMLVTF
jgi:hypothetical protein